MRDALKLKLQMKAKHSYLPLLLLAGLATTSSAQSFSDDFSSGISSQYFTQSQTTPGLYTVNDSGGNVKLSGENFASGGQQSVQESLNFQNALGETSIAGNFSMSIDLSNLILPGTGGNDQAEFHATFADSSIFFDVRDTGGGQNVHVYDGSGHGNTLTNLTALTFNITRVNGLVSGYYNNNLIFSETDNSALVGSSFVLQNNGGTDSIGATFDNYSIQAAPEPVTMSLGLGMIGVFIKRKLKK